MFPDTFYVSEEGNQASAKQTFGFTRAYMSKRKSCETATAAKQTLLRMKRKENKEKGKGAMRDTTPGAFSVLNVDLGRDLSWKIK